MSPSFVHRAISYYPIPKPIKIIRASAGVSTAVWIVTTEKQQKYALRIYTPESNRKSILLEIKAMRLFHQNDLPVPKVYPSSDGKFLVQVCFSLVWHNSSSENITRHADYVASNEHPLLELPVQYAIIKTI